MSVIAVKVTPEDIVIGSDSSRVLDYTCKQMVMVPKITELTNIIIASPSYTDEPSFLVAFSHTRSLTLVHADIFHFFLDFESWLRTTVGNPDYDLDAEYLIIGFGQVYYSHHQSIRQITDFFAIGEGAGYALGALQLGHSVEEAIDAACEQCRYCEQPIHIIRKTL